MFVTSFTGLKKIMMAKLEVYFFINNKILINKIFKKYFTLYKKNYLN